MPEHNASVNFTYITQSSYNNMQEVDPNTLYFIQDNVTTISQGSPVNTIQVGEHITGMDVPYGDSLEYGQTVLHSYAIYTTSSISGTSISSSDPGLILFNSPKNYEDGEEVVVVSPVTQDRIAGTIYTLPAPFSGVFIAEGFMI